MKYFLFLLILGLSFLSKSEETIIDTSDGVFTFLSSGEDKTQFRIKNDAFLFLDWEGVNHYSFVISLENEFTTISNNTVKEYSINGDDSFKYLQLMDISNLSQEEKADSYGGTTSDYILFLFKGEIRDGHNSSWGIDFIGKNLSSSIQLEKVEDITNGTHKFIFSNDHSLKLIFSENAPIVLSKENKTLYEFEIKLTNEGKISNGAHIRTYEIEGNEEYTQLDFVDQSELSESKKRELFTSTNVSNYVLILYPENENSENAQIYMLQYLGKEQEN